MVTVLFDCGASMLVNPDKVSGTPPCPAHGSDCRVDRVSAPAPRITGHAAGPLVDSKYLGPVPVQLAPDGPLTLNARKDDARGTGR